MIVIDLKKYKTLDLSFYLALEEYLANIELNDDCFFLWDIDKSIIVGINQLIETEVNLDFVKENDFKVYRRPSGGGAIYADSGDFMFTFITKRKTKDETFSIYLNKIIDVLNNLGIDTTLSGRNDLLYQGKKFSGSALYYKNDKTIIHGTFLYNADLDNLEKFLTPSSDKLASNGVKSVKSRVINLKDYLSNLSKLELMDFFIHHIDKDITFKYLSELEYNEVLKIKEKYDSFDYIYRKTPSYSFHNKKRFDFGEVEIYLDIYHNIIKDIKICGDFFLENDLKSLYERFINKTIDNIELVLQEIDISNYIIDMTKNDFIKLVKERN